MAIEESLRLEGKGFIPELVIMVQGKEVRIDCGAFWEMVAIDTGVLLSRSVAFGRLQPKYQCLPYMPQGAPDVQATSRYH